MLMLMSWRVWVAIAIAAALAFSHSMAYRKGKFNVQTQWKASIAEANDKAREIERLRQSAADKAAERGTTRQGVIADRSRDAAGASVRLRDAIAARSVAEESAASASARATLYGNLLTESGDALREMALACERHSSDVRLLLDAWPR